MVYGSTTSTISLSATGMQVIDILRTNPSIIFTKPNHERASWWDVPLNIYNNYDEESNAMRDALKKSGVESTKVTHHRTQAVQFAGKMGLTTEQVTTLTKHITNKINVAYLPEVEEETMKVMSGFEKVNIGKITLLFYLHLEFD